MTPASILEAQVADAIWAWFRDNEIPTWIGTCCSLAGALRAQGLLVQPMTQEVIEDEDDGNRQQDVEPAVTSTSGERDAPVAASPDDQTDDDEKPK